MARNRTTSKKNVQSKRLIDRVVPMDKIKKVGVAKKKTVEHTKEGFSVVNGKLVSSNDVGVLLREAQGAIDKRTNVSQRNRKKGIKNNRPHKDINSSPGWGNAHRGTDWQSEKANGMNRANNSRNFTTNIKLQRQHFGEEIQGGSQLVISTNSDASDKLLMLFNLTLGVDQENLKNVLENISQVQIAQIRVRDLPSGSATAKVRLAYPTTQSLEKVRKLFHGALVDGRRIQVVIASDESSHLSY
ncbi:BFH_collapsed_G0024840.mRNA.1.CDS.1 [Saccharomyces cerevisiae]|nr:BGP_1a_G0024000.mRNA.1.CDS.1 [Saccharomyces cerevisiae]CAI5283275.1 BFH_HP2_G0024290.mRNA.1.CDS.1 [Saccharomyces cerevisiae]CAI6560187.1 BFH_HP2_G0024290.mRNA.1.CDS.1 [Saccharomyces cerevisiae]CAI6569339.1 BFH_HP1_G0024530.mRNA.1.CDS.1 [Saccharomyces cerevisiae]CAI7149726.1 BGP_1a_G0024000.mRNA.1.CDS.1 [Saccharomyces cerevisiae]